MSLPYFSRAALTLEDIVTTPLFAVSSNTFWHVRMRDGNKLSPTTSSLLNLVCIIKMIASRGMYIAIVEFVRRMLIQQARGIRPLLFQCWASVEDFGPTLKQQSVNASCFLGRSTWDWCTERHIPSLQKTNSSNYYSKRKKLLLFTFP